MSSKNGMPVSPYVYTGVYGLVTDPADIRDKEDGVKLYMTMALCRTQQMFVYNNLPDTIPQRSLELYIQTGGSCCIAEREGKLYAFFGTMGGEPNEYYMPTKYVVANPYLNFSKEFTIHKDCVVIPNDAMYMGLVPLFRRYATQLVENDISLLVADVNSRIASLLTGNTDRDIASAKEYIKKIWDGELGVAMSTPMMEGLKTQPYGETSSKLITDLIELQQYYKASMFNDIGLNANYNMKRETIVSAEIEMNADALFPFVDNMLYCRELAIKEVNELFGTDIEVHLSSSWEQLKNDREVATIIEEAEALSAIEVSSSSSQLEDENIIDDVNNDVVSDEVEDNENAEDTENKSVEENVESKTEIDEEEPNEEKNDEKIGETDEEKEETDEDVEEIKETLIEKLEDVVEVHDQLDESDEVENDESGEEEEEKNTE